MAAYSIEDVERVWEANRVLREKVQPYLTPTFDTKSKFQHTVAVAFGRTLETFQAVQLLCNPNSSPVYWIEGFILTRSLFETYVTLRWISLDATARTQQFLDEFHLKVERAIRISVRERDSFTAEQQKNVVQTSTEVRRRYGLGKGASRLMPGIEPMVREIDKGSAGSTNLCDEYERYYRDVSQFVHLSSWGLFHCLVQDDVAEFQTPDVGVKAVFQNGRLFVRLLAQWNDIFKVMSDSALQRLLDEWEACLPSARSHLKNGS